MSVKCLLILSVEMIFILMDLPTAKLIKLSVLLICLVFFTHYLELSNFSFILRSGMSCVRTLNICLLLVYFVSAAGCHCFDLKCQSCLHSLYLVTIVTPQRRCVLSGQSLVFSQKNTNIQIATKFTILKITLRNFSSE